MPRVRHAFWVGAAVSLALVRHPRPARAVDAPAISASETFADGDAAGVEYVDKIKASFAERAADLESASRDAREKHACARADLTLSIRVMPDGTITDAKADPTPQLPDELVGAVIATVKTWKAPPTPRAQPVRLRVSLGLIPPTAPAAALDCGAEILDKGSYNVSELVPGIEGGAWQAVCRPRLDVAGEVRAVKLRLRHFHSDAAGDDKGEATGREVVVTGCDAPAFLFRGLATVKKGPLVGAKVLAKTDAWDSTADIILGDTSYHLRIDAKAHAIAGTTERPWTILLEQDGMTEELDAGHTTLAPLLHVRWAGDLDGDGRPDFVLENHSDGVSLQLFLSSSAVGHRRVRRVAMTSWGGR
jgi:hypothetical protein